MYKYLGHETNARSTDELDWRGHNLVSRANVPMCVKGNVYRQSVLETHGAETFTMTQRPENKLRTSPNERWSDQCWA